MRVLGLVGSLRRGSYNGMLIDAAAEALPADAELVRWERIADLPAYDEDLDAASAPPPAVRELREAAADAEAVLIATPEYNASIPGALKNALDWLSRPHATNPLRGKPAAVIGASTGLFGAVWAQAEMRKVLKTIGADVIDRELPVGQAHEAFDSEGRLRDAATSATLGEIVGALVERATSSDTARAAEAA